MDKISRHHINIVRLSHDLSTIEVERSQTTRLTTCLRLSDVGLSLCLLFLSISCVQSTFLHLRVFTTLTKSAFENSSSNGPRLELSFSRHTTYTCGIGSVRQFDALALCCGRRPVLSTMTSFLSGGLDEGQLLSMLALDNRQTKLG